jgi:hypothetical protein
MAQVEPLPLVPATVIHAVGHGFDTVKPHVNGHGV